MTNSATFSLVTHLSRGRKCAHINIAPFITQDLVISAKKNFFTWGIGGLCERAGDIKHGNMIQYAENSIFGILKSRELPSCLKGGRQDREICVLFLSFGPSYFYFILSDSADVEDTD